MLFMPENSESDRDLTTRLMEQQEFFQKKQKLYEEERSRLLQILQNREQLCQEMQNAKSNESEYIMQELEAKLVEKEDLIADLAKRGGSTINRRIGNRIPFGRN